MRNYKEYNESRSKFTCPESWQPFLPSEVLPFEFERTEFIKAECEPYDHLKSGEIKLILAIFNQCLDDVSHAPDARPERIKKYRLCSWRFHSAEAQIFMQVDNPALIDYCSYLQTSPEKIVEKFNTLLYKLRRGIICTV